MFLYRLFCGMEIHLYSTVLPESCIHLKEKETCMNEKRKSGTCLILSAVCSEELNAVFALTHTATDSISGFATVRTLLLLLCALLPIFVLFSDLSKIFTSADQHSAQTTHFLEKRTLCLPLPAVYIPETDKYSCLHSNR